MSWTVYVPQTASPYTLRGQNVTVHSLDPPTPPNTFGPQRRWTTDSRLWNGGNWINGIGDGHGDSLSEDPPPGLKEPNDGVSGVTRREDGTLVTLSGTPWVRVGDTTGPGEGVTRQTPSSTPGSPPCVPVMEVRLSGSHGGTRSPCRSRSRSGSRRTTLWWWVPVCEGPRTQPSDPRTQDIPPSLIVKGSLLYLT